MRGHRTTSDRPAPDWVTTVVMWGLATGLAASYSWNTRWGPTLFGVTEYHGLHLVDLVAFATVWAWAWWAFPLFGPRRQGPLRQGARRGHPRFSERSPR